MLGFRVSLFGSVVVAHGVHSACTHQAAQGGNLEADVILLSLPRNVVTPMLPEEVKLGPELDGFTHIPVTFAFAVHTAVCNSARDETWLDGRFYNLDYNEFIVSVPAVQFSKPKPGQITSSFTYIPRTYVDDQFAMVLRWSLSLVDADQAHITRDASSWGIGDFQSNQTMLALKSTAETPWVHYSTLPIDSVAKLVVPDLLQAPQLGNAQGPPGIPEMFPACLDRNMSVESALVQPLSGHLSVPENLDIIPALQYTFNSSSAFRLRASWTTSMPNDCKGSAQARRGVDYAKLVSLGQLDVAERTSPQIPAAADSSQQCTHPPGAGGGGGAYLADFVIALMETAIVEKMLPSGVQLPLAARISPVTPVMFVFGYQYGVCDNTDSKAWLDGRSFVLNYNEFIMAIPDVEFSDPPKGQARGSHTYQPKLFLDSAVPMALGWGFGIDKVLAHFEHDAAAGSWSVKDWDNNVEMLALKSKNSTGWLPVPSFSADSVVGLLSAALQGDGFGTPILGLSGRGYQDDPHGQGFFTCGVFSWDLLDHAEAQLFHGEMNVRQAVDDGHVMKPFNHRILTGVRLRTNWTMSFPNDCSHPAEPGVARQSWLKLRDLLLDTRDGAIV